MLFLNVSKNIKMSSFLVVIRTLFKCYKNVSYNILLTLFFITNITLFEFESKNIKMSSFQHW